jgi:4-amino-4-deoxy-L-arabinose transferase-like glycosyltransferase
MQFQEKYTKEEKRGILGLLFLASSMVVYLFVNNPNMTGDGIRYLLPIHNLMSGKGYTFHSSPMLLMPPGYGLLSYIVYLFTRDIEVAGMLVPAISYIFLIPITYSIARSLFGKKCAFLAAFFITFSPTIITYSYVTLSDLPFTLFFTMSFGVYVRILLTKSKFHEYVLLGILLGFSYLIRPEAFLIAVLGIVVLFIFSIVESRQSKNLNLIISPIIATLVFLIIIFPYLQFIHKNTGVWTFSTKTSYNLFIGEKVVEGLDYVDSLPSEHPEYFQPGYNLNIFDYVQSRGWKFFTRIKTNARQEFFYVLRMTFHALAPLGFLWLLFPFLSNRRLLPNMKLNTWSIRVVLSFVIFLSPLLAILIFFITSRFLLPYLVLFFILLAFLIERFLVKLLESVNRNYFVKGVAIICLISLFSMSGYMPFSFAPSLYATLRTHHGHLGLRAAGFWLRNNVQINDALTIITPRKGSVVLFYASGKREPIGRSEFLFPDMTLEEVSNVVTSGQADYLILDNHFISTRPQLLPIWNNPNIAKVYGLKLVYSNPELCQIYSKSGDGKK